MNSKTKRVTTIGMLCAITYATMVVGRIPIILFLKYDPSDVIVTLGGFIWGPMTSCIVSVIVAILEMITVSDTGILGVILEQQEVYLSTNEFEVLYLLLQSPQTAFTKEQIYEQIWHEPTNNHLHAVENTIFQIRKRLKPYCMGHEYIKTVIGYGYKFNSE